MITAGTCRGTGCGFCAFSWSVGLKLGGYGILQFSLKLFPLASLYFSPVLLVLGLLGAIWGGFITCRQVDFKRLVADSSVAHIRVVVILVYYEE